jgi:DNA gyrase subunit A
VHEDDAVMLMNTRGITIRIPAAQISRIGRTTQGVTLMRISKDEEVASMTIINPKDPESTAQLNGLDEVEA